MTQAFLRALNQVLAAGIGITALSLWLYALAFNLRNRVAFTFSAVMLALALAFGGESLGSAAREPQLAAAWFKVQWIGVILLPAVYLHLSDALLATTGRPSRGRRIWLVRAVYAISLAFLFALLRGKLLGKLHFGALNYYSPTPLSWGFVAFYIIGMGWAWVNFLRAYRRTVVSTSRQRMLYLLLGALAPTFGAFPYSVFLGELGARAPTLFLLASITANIFTTILLVVMAYAVAFFGVPWPDRVVKLRLARWLLRGPVTVSAVLALTTAVRRFGEHFGHPYTVFAPLTMVVTFLLLEHLIGATAPLWEPLVAGDDQTLRLLSDLEERLFTRQDLAQLLEAVLAALCDHLRVPSAFILGVEESKLSMWVSVGPKTELPSGEPQIHLSQESAHGKIWKWDGFCLLPLHRGEGQPMLGVMGFPCAEPPPADDPTIQTLAERAALALEYFYTGERVAKALQAFPLPGDLIPRLRAVARYDQKSVLAPEDQLPPAGEMVRWVKDALSHYWGGPKLSSTPLANLQVVQETMRENEEDLPQAVRTVLRAAVERLRPRGERGYTTEWLLYNILEMKFLQGHKVVEVAKRLALSEASFYRKQRVALEEVVRVLLEMEAEARKSKAIAPKTELLGAKPYGKNNRT